MRNPSYETNSSADADGPFNTEEGERMRLYLVQHGEAKSKDVDPGRGLTDSLPNRRAIR